MKTKNNIRFRLNLAMSMAKTLNELIGSVSEDLLEETSAAGSFDAMVDELLALRDGEEKSAEFIENFVEKYVSPYKSIPEGQMEYADARISYPYEHMLQSSIDIGKGSLIAYVSNIGTQGAGIVYRDNETGHEFDICYAESRKGDYAVMDGLDEDNDDVSVIVHSDLRDEDYTWKYSMYRSEIEQVIKEN